MKSKQSVMMKSVFSQRLLRFLVFPVLAALLFTACSKSENKTPPFVGRTSDYKLHNLSTGTSVEAGTFTITELSDGNAKLSIQLGQGYLVAGAKFKTTITVPQATGSELLFADLGEMDGGTGTLVVNPIVSGATNVPAKYNDLIHSGYLIKVMNGNNLQASGVIQ
jgi:hypothetical protein